jgi:hypothetical protein
LKRNVYISLYNSIRSNRAAESSQAPVLVGDVLLRKFEAFDPNKTGAVPRSDFQSIAKSFSSEAQPSNKLGLVETMFIGEGDVFNYADFLQFLGAKMSPPLVTVEQAAPICDAGAPARQEAAGADAAAPTNDGDAAQASTAGGRFEVGMAVDAMFGGKDKWYSGKINEVNGDGTYYIEYADGDKEENVAEELIRPQEAPAAAPVAEAPADADKVQLEMGLAVEAKYGGKGLWYGGKIMGVHEDCTYDIVYDDGDAEMKVPRALIRTLQERSDVCPLALHPVLSKMSFAGKLQLSGCEIQSSCNGLYLLNHSTYKGYPMYKKLHQEQVGRLRTRAVSADSVLDSYNV